MWISELRVCNVKSFADSKKIELSRRINVFVGKNNAGKSTLLQSVLCMQSANQTPFTQLSEAVRIGASNANIDIKLQDIKYGYFKIENETALTNDEYLLKMRFARDSNVIDMILALPESKEGVPVSLIPHQESQAFIRPYTVRRFSQNFSPLTSNSSPQPAYVFESLAQLADKMHPFTQISNSRSKEFEQLCQSLIGYPMGIIASTYGHLPGIYAGRDDERIALSQMGDGVPHILGLIIHLLKAKEKLFIIEELESGINPEPLKLLLNEIKRSAKEQHNQFLISTHSNIVLQSLASEENCNIIEVRQVHNHDTLLPESSCRQIDRSDVEARRRVLSNLGYSLADSDMFDGWLILEEASAETIIRKFLIPHFTPKLSNVLGIIATKGYHRVESQFTELEQNFLYLHLTSIYKKRIWVIIDEGEEEKGIVKRLQDNFSLSWSPEHFSQFSEHDFEKYYPSCFQNEVEEISKLNSNKEKQEKRNRKEKLIKEVMKWIEEDTDRAKEEFSISAQEVIEKLVKIESALLKKD